MYSQEGATKSEVDDEVGEVHSPAKSDISDNSDRWFDYNY